MRDLPSRRGHELAHDPCGRLLLREGQPLERSVNVLAHDGARASDLAQCGETQLPLAFP